jgi:hypothetical protein
MRVLIRRSGQGKFAAPEIASYGNEAQLQELIARTPDLLPGIDAACACRKLDSAERGDFGGRLSDARRLVHTLEPASRALSS